MGSRLEVGCEKVACWSTKAAVFLKRVKIDEKLLWRASRNSPTLFRTVPSPTLYGLLFPKIGVRNPTPKLQSLLSQERVKLRTSNLAGFRSILILKPEEGSIVQLSRCQLKAIIIVFVN